MLSGIEIVNFFLTTLNAALLSSMKTATYTPFAEFCLIMDIKELLKKLQGICFVVEDKEDILNITPMIKFSL